MGWTHGQFSRWMDLHVSSKVGHNSPRRPPPARYEIYGRSQAHGSNIEVHYQFLVRRASGRRITAMTTTYVLRGFSILSEALKMFPAPACAVSYGAHRIRSLPAGSPDFELGHRVSPLWLHPQWCVLASMPEVVSTPACVDSGATMDPPALAVCSLRIHVAAAFAGGSLAREHDEIDTAHLMHNTPKSDATHVSQRCRQFPSGIISVDVTMMLRKCVALESDVLQASTEALALMEGVRDLTVLSKRSRLWAPTGLRSKWKAGTRRTGRLAKIRPGSFLWLVWWIPI
ncbi:hypothetical protein C8J57DRAFT_1247116 [Mycena rebaudengoi]|nr:hypothetical protein C8J57DRAFT_1247116 [Mycena rebaudengoi]